MTRICCSWRYGLAALLAVALTACTPTQLKTAEEPMYFAGRLSLTEEHPQQDITQQTQSWTAHFELAGRAEKGTLFLYTPVGTTVAKVIWQADQALVESSNGMEYFNSLEELSRAYFHQNIPITSLFDWLQGNPSKQEISGWNVDLSKAERGIIKAERFNPRPRVSLKVVVDEQHRQIAAP